MTTFTDEITDTLPHNNAAEQTVLGILIQNPMLLDQLGDTLIGEHFYNDRHHVIFETLAIMHAADPQPGDASMRLLTALSESGSVARVGGAPYLYDLTSQTVANSAILEEAAKLVLHHAGDRDMVALANRIKQRALSGNCNFTEVLGVTEEQLRELAAHYTINNERDLKRFGEILEAGVDSFDADSLVGAPRFHWGISELDEVVPLRDSMFVVIGARPSVGKSTMGIELDKNAFPHRPHTPIEERVFGALMDANGYLPGRPVLFNSLEMSENEIVCNVLASTCKVDKAHMAKRSVTDNEMIQISREAAMLADAPLHINANPNQNLRTIRRDVRELTTKYGEPPLVIVDYLQLMTAGVKAESRQQEVSIMSRGLKLLAKEFPTTVIGLSQLNRGSEQRKSPVPVLSDLRESGSIEQDADAVILLDRPDMREEDCARLGEIDLIVAKNRGGVRRTIPAVFQGGYSKICDMAR